MRVYYLPFAMLSLFSCTQNNQEAAITAAAPQRLTQLDKALAEKLARLPLKCIQQEYPNKTSHSIESAADAAYTPSQLHPSFYGCFDWHSSVHGHWMLVRLLRLYPDLAQKDSIMQLLETSFDQERIRDEAAYFNKYTLGKLYERTYGWAWLLRLDQELREWNDPRAKIWHQHLQPLTQTIVSLWKEYLPKQSYPNRTGVHPNTAFAMMMAIDWSRSVQDKDFEKQLLDKSKAFYADNRATPAYLEPDGSDFFSPSLCIADLMTRVLGKKEYRQWFDAFYEKRSISNICTTPHVSDRMDYQITHLDGLMLSRAWNMRSIISYLEPGHPARPQFIQASEQLLQEALANLDKGNYGGEHWLASFAVYALSGQ